VTKPEPPSARIPRGCFALTGLKLIPGGPHTEAVGLGWAEVPFSGLDLASVVSSSLVCSRRCEEVQLRRLGKLAGKPRRQLRHSWPLLPIDCGLQASIDGILNAKGIDLTAVLGAIPKPKGVIA